MLKSKIPRFLKNKEWYYYDINTGRYKLTDKATKKAIESYKKYYESLDEIQIETNNKSSKTQTISQNIHKNIL